jgi:hypothetical protein
MRRNARYLGPILLALASGCVGHTSSFRPERSTHDSRSVPGLTLDLQELGDGVSVPHPSDDAWRDHLQEVDTRSTLRLTFYAPRNEELVAESPEWRRLDAVAARLGERLQEYRTLTRDLAQRSTRRSEEVAVFAGRVAEFRRREREFVAGLAEAEPGPALLTREELAIVSADPAGPEAGLSKWLSQQLLDLAARARARTAARDDVLVTVRARLQPAIGLEQWLQVPGYWEKKGDEPANDLTRNCSFEAERLRAEFAAAARIAGELRDLKRAGDAIAADLRLAVETTRDRMVTRMRELAEGRGRTLAGLRERGPKELDALAAEEREFWTALATLIDLLKSSRDEWRDLVIAAESRSPRDQLADVVGAIDALERRRSPIDAAVAKLKSAAPVALSAAPAELKPEIASLQHDLATKWPASLDALFAAPAETKQALEAARPLVDEGASLLIAVERLPADVDSTIPRPPAELPPVDLDLRRQPINAGDRLKLEVAFFDRDEYVNAQSQGRTAEPLETIRYTNSAMKSGWMWSGDLIFTQQINADNHDFSSTAAVSYEHHWRDRDEPRGILNLIDPGVGFHAAALNFDPDVSLEFGLGLNASVLGGLIRAGVGYDVSISRDREYWFIGFGLVTTLETMKAVGDKAFGM